MSELANARSLSPNTTLSNESTTRTCTHKEYGEHKGKRSYTTMCTQCKRVRQEKLIPPALSIRLSKDEEEHNWVHADDLTESDSQPTGCLTHGLCRSCFNNMDADLTLSPLSLGPLIRSPKPSSTSSRLLSKSLSSPHLTRPLPSPPSPPRVLVVDDNGLQRQIHKRMVEQEGYACDVAISGASAIEMAKKGKYCLVLMDLVMSPLDGWTTAKTIRTFSPSVPSSSSLFSSSFSSPSIVAVTGMPVDERLRQECTESGMNDVVQKPISPAILNKLLRKHTPSILDR